MMIRNRHWLLAGSAAISLHLSAALLLPQSRDGARDSGEQGITVGLGFAGNNGVHMGAATPAPEARQLDPAPKMKPVRPERTPGPAPSVRQPPEPTQAPAQKKLPPSTAAQDITDKTVSTTAMEAGKQTNTVPDVISTGTGQQLSNGGVQGKVTYFTELSAWLARHKPYPFQARRRRQQGVVEVRFTLLRNGTLVDALVSKSSGFSLLDRAALQMLQDASPMPAFPDTMVETQRTFTVPISFTLLH